MRIKDASDLKVGMVFTYTEYTIRTFMDPQWEDTVTILATGPKRTRYHLCRRQAYGYRQVLHDGNHADPTDLLVTTLKTYKLQRKEGEA